MRVPRRARRLTSLMSQNRLAAGAIYPDQSELRTVSARIADAEIHELSRQQAGRTVSDETVPELVSRAMWYPEYST